MSNVDAKTKKLKHFEGTFEKLERFVSKTGIDGVWYDLDDQRRKRFVAYSGAILNFWTRTGTVNFQGGPQEAIDELRNRLIVVISANTNSFEGYI